MTTDTVIDLAWSDLGANHTIRWATPRWVKYGRIVERKGHSIRAQFFDEPRERVIPEAKWYWGQFKMHGSETEEHLCVVEYRPAMRGSPIDKWDTLPPDHPFLAQDDTISVAEACELVRMDPKQLRRNIRSGKVRATKDRNEQWRVSRSHLMEISAKYGWI